MMWVDTDGCVSAAQYCKYFITSVEKGIQAAVKTAVLSAAQRHVQGRHLRRHAGQRRRHAGPVPRLRQQGPGVRCSPSSTRSSGQIISGKIVPATKSPV